ncbi:MAG: fimbrillin family protein [Tidjanibacter sp.]|nr:fimbrillin family protein [Tidjanibacter sp.]
MKLNRIFVITLLVCAGCVNEDFKGPDRVGVDLLIEAEIGAEQTSDKTGWVSGDMIGVSIAGLDGYATSTNVPYCYNETENNFVAADKQIYLKGARQDFTAYYPYVKSDNTHPVGVSVYAGEERQTESEWGKLDYLYATASATRNEPSAKFTFNHVMGQLLLHFDVEGGFSGELSYTISGLKVDGEFDTANGIIEPIMGAKTAQMSLSTSAADDVLMVIPQTANLKLELLYNNKIYSGLIEAATFTAATSTRYNITVNSSTEETPSLIITSQGIGDWVTGSGGTVESTPEEGGETPDDPKPDDPKPENPEVEIPDGGDSGWKEGEGGSVESEPEDPEEPQNPEVEFPEGDNSGWEEGEGGSVESEPEVTPELENNGSSSDWQPGQGGTIESEEEA